MVALRQAIELSKTVGGGAAFCRTPLNQDESTETSWPTQMAVPLYTICVMPA